MESWQLAIVLKPFGLILLFVPGAFFSRWLRAHMPDGRLKRFLFISWKI